MKDATDAILRPQQAAYLDRVLPPRDSLMKEMEQQAAGEGIPISDPEVGRLLETLAVGLSARRILEVGTAIGYGTLWLARGAPAATIVTLDRDPQRIQQAQEYLQRAKVVDRVEFVQGDALESLATLEGEFDLMYIDAEKTEYRRYLDLGLQRLRVGGCIVADNLLWKGWVADPQVEEDAATRSFRAFNGYFLSHPQLASVIVPLGDGVGIACKRQALVTDRGGPF